MTRPSLGAAIDAQLAAQKAKADTHKAEQPRDPHAEQLDQLAARARETPGWLAAQPDHTRTAITNWMTRQDNLAANTPKDAA